jgi:hypothetical protein
MPSALSPSCSFSFSVSLAAFLSLSPSHPPWKDGQSSTIAAPFPISRCTFPTLVTASTTLSCVALPLPQPAVRTLRWPLLAGHGQAAAGCSWLSQGQARPWLGRGNPPWPPLVTS